MATPDDWRTSGNTAARPADPGAGAIHFNTQTREIEHYTAGAWSRLSYIPPKDNRTADTDPGVGDDSADGYEVGSIWLNTATGKLFVADDVSVGAAVWRQIGGSTAVSFAKLRHTANQAVATSTNVALTWSVEDYDTAAYHDTGVNPTRITVPSTGLYGVYINFKWASSSGGTRRAANIRVNGTDYRAVSTYEPVGDVIYHSSYAELPLTAGDYFEVVVWHNVGSSINVEYEAGTLLPNMIVRRLGDLP